MNREKDMFQEALQEAIKQLQIAQDELDAETDADARSHARLEDAQDLIYKIIKARAEEGGK